MSVLEMENDKAGEFFSDINLKDLIRAATENNAE